MASRRVETRDLAGPEALQVSRDSGDTYVRPEQPVQNNDMERLGQALSHFSGALAGVYGRMEADQKRTNAEAMAEAKRRAAEIQKQQDEYAKAEAYRYITSASQEELNKGVANGTVPGVANAATKGIYNSAVGQNIGTQYRADLERDLGPDGTLSLVDEEGRPIPIDKFLADRSKPYADKLFSVTGPGDLHGNEALYRSVEGTREMLLKRQQEQVAGFSAKRNGYVMSTGMRTILGGDVASMTPEQVGERLGAVYGELKQLPGAANVKWNDLDDLAMGTLKTAMQDPNLTPQQARNILKVLDAPRKDTATGQALPGLGANPRFANDVSQLRAEANKAFSKEWETQQKDGLFKQAQQALVRGDGSFDAVQDVVAKNPFTGEMKTFGAKEIKDSAVTAQAQAIRGSVTKQLQGQPTGAVNGQVFAAQAEMFIPAGHLNPEWKGFLHSSIQAAGDTTSLTTPEGQQRMEQAVNLYEALRTRSPAYVDSLLDGKDKDFYETYHLLRKMGKTGQEAVEGAGRAIHPDSANGDQVKAQYQQINDEVKKLSVPGSGWWSGFFGITPTNLGTSQTEIVRRAQLLVRTQGVGAQDAVKAAAQSLGQDVPAINGQFQFNRSSFLAKGKEPVVQEQLDQIYQQFPNDLKAQGVYSPSELSVRFENGIYRVINAATGSPLYSVNGDKLVFTDKDLRTTEKIMSTTDSVKRLQDQEEAKKSRAGGQELFQGTPAAPAFNLLSDPQLGARIQQGVKDFFVSGAKARSNPAGN